MPVSIAGTHRSGTSMVARLLNLCGLDLGPLDQLMQPGVDNPEGFWESLPFFHLNEELLAGLGGTWHLPPPTSAGWEGGEQYLPLRQRAAVLPAELGLKEPWGWKDPRNSITIRFWTSIWPDLRVVVCVRHPLEVANSLLGRDGLSPLTGLRLWLRYCRDLFDVVPPDRLIVTHYESYFTDPAAELRRVVDFLRLPADDATIRNACAAVVPGLRHSRFGAGDLERVEAPPDVIAMYRRLTDEAGPVFARRPEPAADERDPLFRATRIGIVLETRVEAQQAELGRLDWELQVSRAIAGDRARRVHLLEERLRAKRHRYADRIAETLLKVTRPLRPK